MVPKSQWFFRRDLVASKKAAATSVSLRLWATVDFGQGLSRQTCDATTVGTQTNRREATGLVDPLPGVPNSDLPGAGWEGLESRETRTSVAILAGILQGMDHPDPDQSSASPVSRRGDTVVLRFPIRLHISRRVVETNLLRQIAN